MKKLFIYYSLSGNGDMVAKRLSELGYDLRKVETAKKMPESFFLRILAGGGEAPKAVARLEKEYPGSRVRVLKEPLKYPEELDKLDF